MRTKVLSLVAAILISTAAFADGLQLETIGASGGSNLYLTYLSISVIADSYTKKIYQRDQTVSLITSIIAQAGVQKDYLEKLMKSEEVSQSDKEFLKKMIDCYSLLMDEGKYFVEYANSGSAASLKAYSAKREQAGALISDLLGIKK